MNIEIFQVSDLDQMMVFLDDNLTENYEKKVFLDIGYEKSCISIFDKKRLITFVEAIKERKHTIQKVMESIIQHQPDYFQSGERLLLPMILKDIAKDIFNNFFPLTMY